MAVMIDDVAKRGARVGEMCRPLRSSKTSIDIPKRTTNTAIAYKTN